MSVAEAFSFTLQWFTHKMDAVRLVDVYWYESNSFLEFFFCFFLVISSSSMYLIYFI